VQERLRTLNEVSEHVKFLADEPLERDFSQMLGKKLDKETALVILAAAAECLESIERFEAPAIEEALKSLAQELSLKPGPVFITFRIAAVGRKAALPLFESLEGLGRERAVERVKEAQSRLIGWESPS